MAVLEKIRVKFGIGITVIIALALLSFIIDPNTLQSALSSMSSKYDVGKIAGKSISYQDFQKDIDTYTVINEMMTGSSAQNEQSQRQVRDQAWQSLLDKYMFIKNCKAAGIEVGEAEMVDLTSGEGVSPLIAQNFVDKDGNFSNENLLDFIQQAKDDESGRAATLWAFMQQTILTQQYYQRYGSLFTASDFSNDLMVKKAIEENNTTASVDFVMVPFGYAKDTTVTVSGKEISKYYKAHKDFYKQKGSRDIEYVVFEVVPSAEDIAKAKEEFDALYAEFTAADNLKNFLLKNSDRTLSSYFYKAGELKSISEDVENFVFGAANGVSEIFTDDNTFRAAKVVATKMLPDSIYVRLTPATEINDSIIGVLRKAEPMAMTQSYMIPGCESLFEAQINKPVLINTTQYGQLLAEVTSKTPLVQKKQVAILEKTALPSKDTYNSFYSQANELASLSAGKWENYQNTVAEKGLHSQSTSLYEGADRISTIENTREVTRWAFDQKKTGKVSDIITVNQNYFFVVALKEIHKEGYAAVSEVADNIRETLYAEKIGAKKANEAAAKIEGLDNLDAIAEALGTTVSSKEDISFASMAAYGLDAKFIGAVASAQEDVICGPVAGNMGVYVFKVTGRENGSFYTEDDAKSKDAQYAQRNSQMLPYVMMDDADVKDNRARFF